MNSISIRIGEQAQPIVERYESDTDLESLREKVGGWIEVVAGRSGDYQIVCDEDGKAKGRSINFLATLLSPVFGQDWIVGDVLIVGAADGGGEFTDVPYHVAEALITVWGAK